MSVRACLIAAVLVGLAGVGLRLVVPVLPPDASLRAVIEFYRALPPR